MKLFLAKLWEIIQSDRRASIGASLIVLIVFSAIFAPWIAPFDISQVELSNRLQGPSADFVLGTDLHGVDVLTAILYGGRLSLGIGFLVILISSSLGILLGLLSGYFGGWFDYMVMRLADIFLSFPGILLALALMAVLGPSVPSIVLAIAATGWVPTTRVVRSQVLSLRERDYVQAVKSLGGSHLRVLFLYLLPGTIPVILVQATFALSGVILVESSLSFLGLGPQGVIPTWGALLSQGKTVLEEAPHLTLAPGLMIFLSVLSLNFLGDALRDGFDPRSTQLD